MSFQQRISI